MKINLNSNIKSGNGSYFFQYLCAITGALSVFSSTMHYSWPTPSLPKLLGNNSHILLTNSEGSWMAVLFLLGCPIGSIITFLTVDIIGRKKILLLTAAPLISSWIMVAYAGVVDVLYTARFIAGLADGMVYTVIPIYLCEIADPKIRGLLGSSSSVMNMMGILLVNTLGIYFNIRVSALISLCPPILFLLTFSWMPESPYFLMMKEKHASAKSSLRALTGKVDVEGDLNRLSTAVKCNNRKKLNLLKLFKLSSNRKSLLVLIGLRTCQQLSGYTAITFYAQIIFDNVSSIPTLMLGELFPTDIKAFALCLIEIYYGIIATAASKFFQIVKDEVGIYIPLYVFASCCLFGLMFIIRYVPETNGKTLEEIQYQLGAQKPNDTKDCKSQHGI
ncbi:Sugar transporter [Popillia japonica]|uniref:Sugar transporter n=1 Tax=Popillia japonica TaxID=7064 RepID=A0AAW1IT44_POPJA